MEHSCKYYSHPGICLKNHLREVGKQCRQKAIEIGIKDPKLLDAIEVAGTFHDFGKYVRSFQKYLKGEYRGSKKLTRHSAISALFSGWLINKRHRDPFLSAIVFYSVYRHHGNLVDKLFDVFSPWALKGLIDEYIDQLRSISNEVEEVSSEVNYLIHNLSSGGYEATLESFVEECKQGLESLKDVANKFSFNYNARYFTDFYYACLIFSLLIDFDKKSARRTIREERERFMNVISASSVDNYVMQLSKKDKSPMDHIRREIRENVLSTFQNLISHDRTRIMTITAPTGSGKTLLSLSIATRIRELAKGAKPKIIYVLPYINILEQAFEVFKKVLHTNDINILLKHHHRVYGSIYDRELRENINIEDLLLLTESWDSEIILTTSVQFFETLLGWRNGMLKKFNELFNSIIILDEIQTLPIEYWRLVKEALEYFIKISNSYIIYMSATRPIIFEGEELVRNYDKYFKRLARTKFEYIDRDLSIEEAVKVVFDKWRGHGSLLVVLNTINSSIEFYKRFKQFLRENRIDFQVLSRYNDQIDEDKVVLSYLSTNIIPLHRAERIKRIKELLENNVKVVLISTQIVEAGVDLDFDMAVRDIGPFDSIVQVAGRCNRNALRDKGYFYIIRLADENNRLYAKRIYGNLSIDISHKIISKFREFDETKIFDMINKYYEESIRVFGEESDEYIKLSESIKNLNFEELRSFKVIKEQPKYPVFIEYDEKAVNIKNELLNLIDMKSKASKEDVYEILAKIRVKRAELEDYIVETWANVEGLPVLSKWSNIRYISYEEKDDWYDGETGLKKAEDQGAMII